MYVRTAETFDRSFSNVIDSGRGGKWLRASSNCIVYPLPTLPHDNYPPGFNPLALGYYGGTDVVPFARVPYVHLYYFEFFPPFLPDATNPTWRHEPPALEVLDRKS